MDAVRATIFEILKHCFFFILFNINIPFYLKEGNSVTFFKCKMFSQKSGLLNTIRSDDFDMRSQCPTQTT